MRWERLGDDNPPVALIEQIVVLAIIFNIDTLKGEHILRLAGHDTRPLQGGQKK
jgi:hypothetical protein